MVESVTPQTAPTIGRSFTLPSIGEMITSFNTGVTYQVTDYISGEGAFSFVYGGIDSWGNRIAIKVLKPNDRPYETVRDSALAEFQKLIAFRHPTVTHVYDAFEYKDTFYIITERCHDTVAGLLQIPNYNGPNWVKAVGRCVLQAIHFLHINNM